jgi:hypothetical protein
MPDEIPISQMTPEQACQRLDELTAAYRGPAPSAAPTTPAEAAARLRVLANDKAWGSRYLDGNIAERHEFQALSELAASGDQSPDFDIVTVDSVTDPHAVSPRVFNDAMDQLRALGLPDAAERYIIDLDRGVRVDRPTQGDKQAARQALDRLVKNPEWRQAVLSGDPRANDVKNALDRISAYASDDGLPITDGMVQQLRALGLR